MLHQFQLLLQIKVVTQLSQQVCRKIDGCPDGTSTLERIFEGISVYYNYTGKADCFELEDYSDVGTDGWNWQVYLHYCNISSFQIKIMTVLINIFFLVEHIDCPCYYFNACASIIHFLSLIQACTEMVMPMSSSRDGSMFQTYDYNFSSFQEECWKDFNAKPRPTWITTEFGGHVR